MFAPRGWDDGLDDSQLEAVTHGDGPLVIVAGAGTGKTRTLTSRVARLIERGVPAERVLLLTFTRRAADDMLARAAHLSGRLGVGARLRGGTFHAIAHQMVSAWCEPLGLAAGFSVLDPADASDAMDLLRDSVKLTGTEMRMPRSPTLVDIYSRCVNTRRPLSEVLAVDFPWCEPHGEALAALFRDYVAHKKTKALLDFDDLLLYWRAALTDERLATHLAAMFDHVLVDEYQDVNTLQVDIVKCLRPGGQGLTVVGDDAQAVYGFRGADSRHLGDLAESFPSATVVRLEQNFRSRQPILDVANAVRPAEADGDIRLVLKGAREGGRRPVLVRCHDAPSEARAVVDRILANHEAGMRLMEQAVLVRASHHSDLIEIEMTARRVPYRKFGGLRFVEAAHVKDFLAGLRVLDNPSDDLAWLRLLRLHDSVGPARARGLLAVLLTSEPVPGDRAAEVVAASPARARVSIGDMLTGLSSAAAAETIAQRVEAVRRAVQPLVVAAYEGSAEAARSEDLVRLASAAAAVPSLAELRAFVASVTLDPPVSSGDYAGPPHLDEDYVVVSTVHSAKGLEWTAVHLPHLVDGAFPSDMALGSAAGLAEERRLFYVATTRAKDQLTLYSPLRMPHHRRARDDRHSLAPASRFLSGEVLGLLEVCEQAGRASLLAVPAGAAGGAGATPGGGRPGAERVAGELEALWG